MEGDRAAGMTPQDQPLLGEVASREFRKCPSWKPTLGPHPLTPVVPISCWTHSSLCPGLREHGSLLIPERNPGIKDGENQGPTRGTALLTAQASLRDTARPDPSPRGTASLPSSPPLPPGLPGASFPGELSVSPHWVPTGIAPQVPWGLPQLAPTLSVALQLGSGHA